MALPASLRTLHSTDSAHVRESTAAGWASVAAKAQATDEAVASARRQARLAAVAAATAAVAPALLLAVRAAQSAGPWRA